MVSSERPKTGSFVLPGDWLGVIEEFSPNEGTYDEDGKIFASNAGILLIDKVERRVKVVSFEAPSIVKKGSLVLGMVVNNTGKFSRVSIVRVGGKTLTSPCSGIIHVSQISNQFIEKPSDAFKAGDIVRARVIDIRSEFVQLSTVGKNLGVILAFCSKCGSVLESRGNSILVCKSCGNKEKRKVSVDYGKSKV
ncbi:MAG: exosome complex RNA-binding protein Csl4 [Candidatus Jordarchaeales archaeon]